MDTRTPEQVILDAIWKFGDSRELPTADTVEAAAIADAVRYVVELDAHITRIKELEAEVERLKAMTYLPSNEAIDKAAKYDALRERFPFLPGETFYVADEGAIIRRSVHRLYANGRIEAAKTAMALVEYNVSQCHPTADACRAAIPVEGA